MYTYFSLIKTNFILVIVSPSFIRDRLLGYFDKDRERTREAEGDGVFIVINESQKFESDGKNIARAIKRRYIIVISVAIIG